MNHKEIHGKPWELQLPTRLLDPGKIHWDRITNDMTTDPKISWDDIDPTVFIDVDGTAHLIWDNSICYYAKLQDKIVTLDGEIRKINLPNFTEAPYLHKNGEYYYLSYAHKFPEKTAYAMSSSIDCPYNFQSILNEVAGDSNMNHQAN